MKKLKFLGPMFCICLLLAVSGVSIAAGANVKPACDRCSMGKQSAESTTEVKATEGEASCKICGMDRAKFAHSRMLIEYADGTSVGTCSIHCLSLELANTIDKTPKALRVGDYGSRKLIDAEIASWVIGGDKAGVMSSRAKWAFEKRTDAEAFIKVSGGTLGTFEDAVKATYEDLYKDTKMIRDRRKMRQMKPMEQK